MSHNPSDLSHQNNVSLFVCFLAGLLQISCTMNPRIHAVLSATLFAAWSTHSFAADEYPPHPDSQVQPGVPKGSVEKHSFAASKIFPGTERDYWVYVPAQYDPSQ